MDLFHVKIFLCLIFWSNFVKCTIELESFGSPSAFDENLYKEVLDTDKCKKELDFLADPINILRKLKFLDAGIKIPRGITSFNLVDLGNYFQCLDIGEDFEDRTIDGKYCMISVPLRQGNLQWPDAIDSVTLSNNPFGLLFSNNTVFDFENNEGNIRKVKTLEKSLHNLLGVEVNENGRVSTDSVLASLSLKLAACIPKTCTTKEALDSFYGNAVSAGLEYTEDFCRLPNDKPYVTADYVACVIFGLIGLLTLISTTYDINHCFLLKRDPKTANALYRSFSVYTNCKQLVTVTSSPSTIECLDGIRVLAMAWVILGHTYSTLGAFPLANPLARQEWLESWHSILITAAPITVDTFFLLSGLLVVYTTAGKFKRMDLIKNVHLFYLNRLLRMFPILAAAILLIASWYNHVADGPYWSVFASKVDRCRTYWWSTLLYVQNYTNQSKMCVGQGWYLAVDIQLHILSPLVLFWVLSGRRAAWTSMTLVLIASLTAATVYNAVNGFSAKIVGNTRDYFRLYYMNTLTRASPFFVGMLYGYVLYLTKNQKLHLKKPLFLTLWSISTLILTSTILVTYPVQQSSWRHRLADTLINSFLRPLWAAAVGWLIFACHKGYGGPLNWFLSLRFWKVPARLSYAMYIFHYAILNIVNYTHLAPVHFSDEAFLFRFIADFSLALFVAFFATLLIDSPCSTLIKMALTPGRKEEQQKATEKNAEAEIVSNGYTDKSRL
ncbi:hypothetical protein JYU34_008457 [Plutella xylostella]|uniref:Nose resistant-to-fluoxetine protein N-terminal domain-containing protein n=1 Tax=Plutella xylostella TaxID=51655 RepID=A0ABQ7QKZ0_PLUXY|nr:hypothetical protein JYU34_008457 [Plutella xylostella]